MEGGGGGLAHGTCPCLRPVDPSGMLHTTSSAALVCTIYDK
jgi:hypothetical protein